MTDNPLTPDELEVAPGFAHEKLQGSIPPFATDEEIRLALEKAFDYRGDVTVVCKDGFRLDGYLYDRRNAATLKDSVVRVLPSSGAPRVSLSYAQIERLIFSGRDTAAGKSWEAWVRKYWEKRAAGEQAEIEPENLD